MSASEPTATQAAPAHAGKRAATASRRLDPTVVGTALGLVSAITYTLSNMAFRHVAGDRLDLGWALWATSMKAVPVTAVTWAIVGWRAWCGLPAFPPRQFILPLLMTGIIMQFVGNVLFQLSLSLGGLALTVALTFSTLIISGAVLGRMILGEGITFRTLAAMVLLVLAVCVLGRGAEDAALAVSRQTSPWTVLLAVLTGAGSGLGFGLSGVVIRRVLGEQVSLSGTMVILCTTGVVLPGICGAAMLGPAAIAQIPADSQWMMFTGGAVNAVAFFAVTAALRRMPVVRVNLVNASQVAMAALGGVLLFREPPTIWLGVGTGLTMAGLVVLGLSDSRRGRGTSD